MPSFHVWFALVIVPLVGCGEPASESRSSRFEPAPSSSAPWLVVDAGRDAGAQLGAAPPAPKGSTPADAGSLPPGSADAGAGPSPAPGPTSSPPPSADAQAPTPIEAGPTGSLQPGVTTVTIQAAGIARTFYLKVPSVVSQGRVPLVIALHGNGDTAQNFVSSVGLDSRADQDGFVLAAPQGMTRDVTVYADGQPWQTIPQIDWDAYDSIQSDGSITSDDNLDVPLLDAIRTQLVSSGSIDAQHVTIYGYSQGGYMAFRYGMSDAADLACAAVLAAADPLGGTMLVANSARQVPVFLQIGTEDDAFSQAQQTVQELQSHGNTVDFSPIQGAGHVPPPGDPLAPLTWCEGQTL